ncbi:MAG TPA: beta-galactosidase [Spirochaetaceae bacterium]|nr:beta-galactosidase [Spirochaetaceae bacterium]
MRQIQTINRAWHYRADYADHYTSATFRPESWETVCLPHANRELPYNGFDEKCYQFISSYWREIELPANQPRHFLDFEGVMCAADVWVNGQAAGSHRGGYTPFCIELSRFAAPGSTARVLVRVDSTERRDIPPFGHVVDYLCYGGIYREVSLRSQATCFVDDVFARPRDVLADAKGLRLEISFAGVDQANQAGGERRVHCQLLDTCNGQTMAESSQAVPAGNAELAVELTGIKGLQLWDIDQPKLYRVVVSLLQTDQPLDRWEGRVGFRQAEFRPDGFWLNGRRLPIVGLNRHQAWPYVGYAMPKRAQRRDAEILKNEYHVNLVRTSHYPQSRHFLDACDELGLLVFEETPGWQHIGDRAWQDQVCTDIEAMIRRDRNRPSIILWGVRINESTDNHDFYTRSNQIARRLDPDRQTGGVRCIEGSELLEDVYTFNDFTHSGGQAVLRKPRQVTRLKRDVPYLVSEHNGHMYPTKRFDNEERLTEHALRHARVLNTALGMAGWGGAIGWCTFDYNTHKDFGSGDRICYHGVADLFRQPKYAAWLYASQVEPARRVVLEAGCLFAKGERCAARLLPIEIYTNCDSVVLYRAGKRIGEYWPERDRFRHLAHPPVIIRDLIGDQLAGSQFKPRDQAFLRRLVGTIFTSGFEAVGKLDQLRLGLLLARYRMNRTVASDLMAKYAIGWGSQDESFELAGCLAGQEVVRRSYGGDARAVRLSVNADDAALQAGDWDTTRVVIRAEDQYGNLHPFTADAVALSVEGPGAVIGPTLLPLTGGYASCWLRSHGPAGIVSLKISSQRFGEQSISLTVR